MKCPLEPLTWEYSTELFSLGNAGTVCSWGHCTEQGAGEPLSCLGKVWKTVGRMTASDLSPSLRKTWVIVANPDWQDVKVKPSFLQRTKSSRKRNKKVFWLQEAQGQRGGQRDTRAMQDTSLIMPVRASSQDSHGSPTNREEGCEQVSKASSEWEKHFPSETLTFCVFLFLSLLRVLLLAAMLSHLAMIDPGRSWGHIPWTT